MPVSGYRFLFFAHSPMWRARHADHTLGVLKDADSLAGRRSASVSDRLGFLLEGLSYRLARSDGPLLPPLSSAEHRFDQSNGLSVEREPTAFENEHARWWDQRDVPGFVPVAMTGGRAQEPA